MNDDASSRESKTLTDTRPSLLSVGRLFHKTWVLYRERLYLYLSIMAIPAIVMVLTILLPKTVEHMTNALYVFGTGMVVLVLVHILATIALIISALAPSAPSLEEAYDRALKLFVPYVVVSLILGVAVLVGILLLIIPGIIAAVWFAFAPFVLVAEGKKNIDALTQSKQYVSGRWGAVALRVLAIIAASFVVTIFLSFLSAGFSDGNAPSIADAAVQALAMLFVTPFLVTYNALLYLNVKGDLVDHPKSFTAPEEEEV